MVLLTSLESHNPHQLNPWTSAEVKPLTWIAILSLVAWGFGYFGQPHILARFAGIRAKDDVPTARRIAVTWSGLAMAGAILVGLVGLVDLNNQGSTLADGETIFMVLVNAIFYPVIAGILLGAILVHILKSERLFEDVFKTHHLIATLTPVSKTGASRDSKTARPSHC